MKKIIFFGNDLKALIRFRGKAINYLKSNGYDIHIVAPSGGFKGNIGPEFSFTEIKFSPRGMSIFEVLRCMVKFWLIVYRLKPDYVFCYGIKSGVISTLSAILTPAINVTFLTGLGFVFSKNFRLGVIRRCIVKLIGFISNRVVVINKDDKTLLQKFISSEKLVLFPGEGIDIDEFGYSEVSLELREIDFLYLGRFEIDKGFNVFCDSVVIMAEEGLDFRAVVAGGGSQKEYISHLKLIHREKSCPLEDFGYVEDVKQLLSKTKFLVLPSPREGISRAVMEAMSVGTLCIGTDVPGIRELILKNKTGILFAKNDPADLVSAMKSAKRIVPEQYKEIAQAARLHLKINFRQELVNNSYDQLIKNIS